MTSTLNRTLKILFIVVIAVAGATIVYMAGLGTGLYVAQVSAEARPASAVMWSITPVTGCGGFPQPIYRQPLHRKDHFSSSPP